MITTRKAKPKNFLNKINNLLEIVVGKNKITQIVGERIKALLISISLSRINDLGILDKAAILQTLIKYLNKT
jgi:hypothetical protein